MKRIFVLLTPLLMVSGVAIAQNGSQPNSYSNLALQFSSHDVNSSSTLMPAVAYGFGYESYLENPASVALLEQTQFSFSLINQHSQTQSSYLNNKNDDQNSETSLGNLGFLYSFPTIQGSLVIGGGYNRTISNAPSFLFSGMNDNNTITDSFLDSDSKYFRPAFETYAIDWGDEDQTYLESIFRIGYEPGTFPGIDQEVQVNFETNQGEYSAFLATEILQDLFMGVSVGHTSGFHTYERDFLEIDSENVYDGDFIEGSDIDNILVHDEVDISVTAWNLRGGLIYTLNSGINVGLSYVLPTKLRFEEQFYTFIETTLDDGSEPFFYDVSSNGNKRYRIKKPGELKAGASWAGENGLLLSGSAEFINYQNTRVDLLSDRDVRLSDETEIRAEQSETNDFLESNFNQILNFKAGAEKKLNPQTTLRAGYSFLPNKSEMEPNNIHLISAGFKHDLGNNLIINVSGHYLKKEYQSELYDYVDFDGQERSTAFESTIQQLRFHIGMVFAF